MSGFLPTVDILADYSSDDERALWLLNASDGMIVRDYSAIRAILLSCGFRTGLDCLDIRNAALNSVRDDNGEMMPHLIDLLKEYRAVLRDIAKIESVVR